MTVGELLAKKQEKMVEYLLQEGKPLHKYKDKIIEYCDMFAFSENFTWTPDVIRAIDKDDKKAYKAIMVGISNANNEKSSQAGGNVVKRGMRR